MPSYVVNVMLGIKPRVSFMIGNYSANSTTSAEPQVFSRHLGPATIQYVVFIFHVAVFSTKVQVIYNLLKSLLCDLSYLP